VREGKPRSGAELIIFTVRGGITSAGMGGGFRGRVQEEKEGRTSLYHQRGLSGVGVFRRKGSGGVRRYLRGDRSHRTEGKARRPGRKGLQRFQGKTLFKIGKGKAKSSVQKTKSWDGKRGLIGRPARIQ